MKRGLFCILLAVWLSIGTAETAQAAVATIELQTESETVKAGDEFEVTLSITAQPEEGETTQAAAIGDFEAFLLYDADVIEFVTAPSCITGGAGMLRIADLGAGSSYGSRKYVLRFVALERGTAELSFYGMPLVYTYGGIDAMPVSGNALVVAVEAAEGASDNANLSALKVNPGKLSPAFATTIREYEVSVPYETEMIVVSALTEDENARVGVNGSTELKVGRNTAVVTVTAEDGTEKRYYLYVTRQEKTPEPTAVPEKEEPVKELEAGIHATQEKESIVLSYGGTFLVSEEQSAYVAPTGYEETVLYIDGIRVKAYARRDMPESDFFVLVLEDAQGNCGYYRYDREQQTLQRFDEERIEIKQVVEEDNSAVYDALEQYKSQQVLLLFWLAMFVALSVLLLLIVVRLCRKDRSGDGNLDDDL